MVLNAHYISTSARKTITHFNGKRDIRNYDLSIRDCLVFMCFQEK